MIKSLIEIRNELLEAYLELEDSYLNAETTTISEKRISYLEFKMCEQLLNNIKLLAHHYKDDVVNQRYKKHWNAPLVKANKLLEKFGENKDPNNDCSEIVLRKKFDPFGYIENRNFIDEIQ